MSFFKTNTNPEDVVDSSGSNYLNTSGIYDVVLKAATVDVNKDGARTVGLFVNYNGQDQMLYGAIRLDNNDGTPNFQMELFNKLCIIAELDEVQDPVEEDLPIGKKGANKPATTLPDFSNDLELKIRIQMEYSLYNDAIQEKKVVKSFFTPEGASAAEVNNKTEAGKQLEIETQYADNVTYKDGLTAEDIDAWIKGGRGAAKQEPAKKPSFGTNKKPSFNKK